MTLSILIITITSRKEQFQRLYNKLKKQIRELGAVDQVEILSSCDSGELTRGIKRRKLIESASGKYVCFVDDDDDVADTYIADILEAVKTSPDCVGIVGRIVMRGKAKRFTHSIRYKAYGQDQDGYYRPPNHLNPIRRKIAVRYPFLDIDRSEDTDYAKSMARDGVLKTEVFIDKVLYYYTPANG